MQPCSRTMWDRLSSPRVWLAALALAGLLFVLRPYPEVSIYTLEGGEIIALRSMHSNRYLQLDEETGQVFANAESASSDTAQWQVLVLDTDAVRVLARSAKGIDARSELFTGRRTKTASGCNCSGYSNAHGLGRFCHPWEDKNQDAWCYVSDDCTSASSRGSFGRRYEPCDANPNWAAEDGTVTGSQAETTKLTPVSGCNCSGTSNDHGFGAFCKGWEYAGQAPWCYLDLACALRTSAPYGRGNGSFGLPHEVCLSVAAVPASFVGI